MNALVVGGGTMGQGIAAALAVDGFAVEIADVDDGSRERAVRRTGEIIDGAVQRGKIDPAAGIEARERVAGVADIAQAVRAPDVAIEAVPEDLELKCQVLARLESLDPKLLATNTSALSIDALADSLSEPGALVGTHFFNPVAAMKLVEVVVGARTAPEATDRALRLVEALGKQAVVVRDLPGFATSRLGVATGLEAIRMLEDGVASAEDIDRALVLGYRHPVGPLRLTDIVGLDVRLAIARDLTAAYGSRFEPPGLLIDMVAQGKLGQKAGQGFYAWPDD